MRYFHTLAVAALGLGLGIATNASAAAIAGVYNYSYTGTTGDSGCSNDYRDHFSGPGANTVGGSDTITFSACDNTVGIVGGTFSIADASGSVSGTFSGTNTGSTTTIDGNAGFALDDGTYTITSDSGAYAGLPSSGSFEVATGPVGTALQGTGELALGETIAQANAPEPATWGLLGLSFLAIPAFRRFAYNRNSEK